MTASVPRGGALRILLLALQYPPDVNASGRIMRHLAVALSSRGHLVHVLTTFPHYAHFRVEASHAGRLRERVVEDGVDVTRLWVLATGHKQRMTHRLASYLSFNALAGVEGLLRRERFDVCLAPNGSFFTGMTADALRRFRGVPFVYNVQDIYPEVPVQAGQLRNPLAIAGLRRMESYMYRRAAHLTVISPSQRENLLAKGVDPGKVTVVPNFVDTTIIRPLPRDNALARRHDLVGRFVVCHAGNMGFAYDFDTLLETAALLRPQEDVLFLLVGEGVRRAELEARAAADGLTNVRFLPFQPEAELPLLRASCDVQLSLYRSHSAAYSLPSKVYEIMASGRPLVASAAAGSDVARLVEETGAGLWVLPEDANTLAEAILRLRGDEALRAAMGARGRARAETEHSVDAAADAYETLLKRHACTA